MSHDAAILLDFENLILGAENTLPRSANPVPDAPLDLLCRDYGNAAIRRAYANWADPKFGKHQWILAQHGFDLIQIHRIGIQQKNAADIRLAIDAMDALLQSPDITTYVLVTGDGDFSPLVNRLRQSSKHIVVIGTKGSTSHRLKAVSAEYIDWSELVAVATATDDSDRTGEPAPMPVLDLASAEALLLAATQQSTFDAPFASWLKKTMRRLDPTFDEQHYGCSTFKDFLIKLGHLVALEQTNGSPLRVRLLTPQGERHR